MYVCCVFDFHHLFFFTFLIPGTTSEGSYKGKYSPHDQHHQQTTQCRRDFSSGVIDAILSAPEILRKITECVAECPTSRHICENQIRCFDIQTAFPNLSTLALPCDDWVYIIQFFSQLSFTLLFLSSSTSFYTFVFLFTS